MWKTSGRQNFIVRILIFFVWLSTHKCENKSEASTQKPIFCHGLLANLKPWKFVAGQANISFLPWNKAPHWIARGPTGRTGRFTRWRTRGLPRHPAAFARRPRRVTGLWGTRDPCSGCRPSLGCFGWGLPTAGRGPCLKFGRTWRPASTLPFLPLKVMCGERALATENERTHFLPFIPNEKKPTRELYFFLPPHK